MAEDSTRRLLKTFGVTVTNLEDALDAGLREQIQRRGADAEAIAAALDLMLGLFA